MIDENVESTAHQKVLVWIRCSQEGEDLFLLLKTTPERGEFWQPVTGSVELGEAPEAAAKREMLEETGLQPLGDLKAVSSPYQFTSRGRQVQEHPFLAEVDASQQNRVRLDPHEHTEFQWVSAESALQLMKYESNARVLRAIIKKEN